MHNTPHSEESKRKMSIAKTGVPLPSKRRPSMAFGGVEYWQCSTCREFFPREGFYKNKRTILGITSECRKCHGATTIRTRNKNHHSDKRRDAMREARTRDPQKYRDKHRVASRSRAKNERTKARGMLNAAVHRGEVLRPTLCTNCGASKKVTAHHYDYSKPLAVEWICYECHGRRHRTA